ncbi:MULTISPECIES: helix-turn-helix domain-containing protein [unclassified Fusibacter]|uniref:helix-turn-helix domain-containing protein n=1 Tax=unclassified Fusibacter TaxID=2624464 RepID=UPI00101260A8|nr:MULTISPECIES: helix-turn-helix domain-containing protein [unclassified Fusibacter]MCK8060984.1 helix-turn-helix domain-containing protein [Fusibacter sp. A2]NPE20562.1 helix-turn-helix domain-containing protein [Fusibacter sp. A1]RXV63759.1 transcriptional regulator [Fusibacter sp. A1]
MKDVLLMKDLDQIKCISQAYRINILEAFEDQAATAKMISERLGEPHAKINYHLKEMLKHGILNLVEEVVKLGIVEKYYLPVAKQFVVDSNTLKISDDAVHESINQYRLMIFDTTATAFYEAIEDKSVSHQIKLNMLHDMHLTMDEIKEMQDEIDSVYKKYEELSEVKRENTSRYVVSHMILPY